MIGVIGAGVIGVGVAQRFAQHGYEIRVVDIDRQKEAAMIKTIKNSILTINFLQRQKYDYNEVLSRITFATEYSILSDCDYIVENVVENYDVKKNVYALLETVCRSDAVFMANTSCIPISSIASFTRRKEQVIGVHFMNPVPMKNACEVILHRFTSEDTIFKVKELLNYVKIKMITVKDMPGFVSNRISHVLINEAAWVVQDGVAKPEAVDEIFRECFDHKMGPLETADLIGIDTVVNSLDVLYNYYHDPKYKVAPILRNMVDAELLGRKNGKGFYNY